MTEYPEEGAVFILAAPQPEYSNAVGEAAQAYIRSLCGPDWMHTNILPATFRWSDCWDAMCKAAVPAAPAPEAAKPHLFELWWERYMPNATQAEAWEAWQAAPRADGVGVIAPKAQAAGQELPESNSVDEALEIVASFGPLGADLNETHRRQILLANEVVRLRKLGEMAVRGRAQMRAALQDARATLAQRQPLTEWQPIETAPKDGRKMFLSYANSHGKRRTVVGGWVTDDEAAETDTDGVGLEAGWYERIDNWPDYYQVAIHEGEPTHWMPLPADPDAATRRAIVRAAAEIGREPEGRHG